MNSSSNKPILEFENLKIEFRTEYGYITAVDGVSFALQQGKTMGLVGESGCGKSITCLSAMRLLPSPPARISGRILFQGQDILQCSNSEMQKLRGNEMAMIFQEPMTALNPAFRVGNQLSESFLIHQGLTKDQAWKKSVDMLEKVGIPDPSKRVHEYPHQLSGGMRQRVMIAMALACKPKLLIADEPTTALDVTIQAQILELIQELQEELGMAVLFITHDLGVVAELCHEVTVMYAGQVIEEANIFDLFDHARHPYTKGLLESRVTLATPRDKSLSTISGNVPPVGKWPPGCRFANRCERKTDACTKSLPTLEVVGKSQTACFNPNP